MKGSLTMCALRLPVVLYLGTLLPNDWLYPCSSKTKGKEKVAQHENVLSTCRWWPKCIINVNHLTLITKMLRISDIIHLNNTFLAMAFLCRGQFYNQQLLLLSFSSVMTLFFRLHQKGRLWQVWISNCPSIIVKDIKPLQQDR